MSKRPYDIPSLSALVSFEAAARHVSFKRASSELNVTPAAVSHQIKALENELGQNLFLRHRRGVELTQTGMRLQETLKKGFSELSETISSIRQEGQERPVKIQATTAVASLWLTPRLAQFWRDNAHIAVIQHVSDIDDAVGDCDLSIHYGDMSSEQEDCRLLIHGPISALASPAFAETHPVSSLTDLARLPLIHLNASEQTWTTWPDWFAALGYRGPIGEGLRVNNYSIALQAAQDDMGVVLGWDALTRGMVSAGGLVPLTRHQIDAPDDFYIRANRNAPPRAVYLRDWLMEA